MAMVGVVGASSSFADFAGRDAFSAARKDTQREHEGRREESDTDTDSLTMPVFAPTFARRRREGAGHASLSPLASPALSALFAPSSISRGTLDGHGHGSPSPLSAVFPTSLLFAPTSTSSPPSSSADSRSYHLASPTLIFLRNSSSAHLQAAHRQEIHTPPRLRTSRTDRRRLAARAQGSSGDAGVGAGWGCEVVRRSLFEWGQTPTSTSSTATPSTPRCTYAHRMQTPCGHARPRRRRRPPPSSPRLHRRQHTNNEEEERERRRCAEDWWAVSGSGYEFGRWRISRATSTSTAVLGGSLGRGISRSVSISSSLHFDLVFTSICTRS
ncbi:hypothetical protein B0H13DRAFT_630624 [Mycena leptocephala]|nr:hypothetical protein B0H13DRAFT_630624 [Mycena leptocephala]